MNVTEGSFALVIGAGGGIGRAVVQHELKLGRGVIAVSRHPLDIVHSELLHVTGADTEFDIIKVVDQLMSLRGMIDRVVVCTGILHGQRPSMWPEKRLEELSTGNLQLSLYTNAVLPVLWAARLLPLLKSERPCVYATLSARVGSISDNRLGGWYGYRASKSALNMFLKTAAIEYARRADNVKLLLFHPGTTDTELSRPFQERVPPDKLFSPVFVASCLDRVMASLEPDGQIDYLDWQGKSIDW